MGLNLNNEISNETLLWFWSPCGKMFISFNKREDGFSLTLWICTVLYWTELPSSVWMCFALTWENCISSWDKVLPFGLTRRNVVRSSSVWVKPFCTFGGSSLGFGVPCIVSKYSDTKDSLNSIDYVTLVGITGFTVLDPFVLKTLQLRSHFIEIWGLYY